MSTKIVPITRKNLDLMSEAAMKFDMPRSARWLERCMYDPTVEDNDGVRGHMAVRDDGEVVALQGYYYMPGYLKQEKVLINTGCIMGADAKVGEELLCCLDANKETRKTGAICSSNCIASNKSAKIIKLVYRHKEAPQATREFRFAVTDITGYIIFLLRRCRVPNFIRNIIWYALRPVSWAARRIQTLVQPRFGFAIENASSFDSLEYAEFWERLLAANNGLMTSRAPERMAWLFNESIKARFVSLLVAKKCDRIEGYVMVRKMPRRTGLASVDCQVIDICALNNDVNCLKALVGAAVGCAGDMGGLRVFMYGALPQQSEWLNPIFRRRKKEDHPTFLYKVRVAEVEQSLQNGQGWFFGPLDGERCMGNGGYIDL